MRRSIFIVSLVILALSLRAQCVFDPTVIPSNLVLCPNSTDTLWTQVYDSYQWFQNSSPVSGATNQFYVVNSSQAGNYFSVSATLNGCTEMSPQVLVDGWIFLLPFVVHSGDLGYYDPNLDATVLCIGDTLVLTLGQPYTASIQWFSYGDTIAGANNPDFFVTESGSYTVCGAPGLCPDFNQCLGLDINVIVVDPDPEISLINDTLFCSGNNLVNYQWYFNGAIISGATNSFYVPGNFGDYTVAVQDFGGCSTLSDPYTFINTGFSLEETFSINIYPVPASTTLNIESQSQSLQTIELLNLNGQIICTNALLPNSKIEIPVAELAEGIYLLHVQAPKNSVYYPVMKQ